jgi:RNA polymerase sigma-70 factor (ECF subfamily)
VTITGTEIAVPPPSRGPTRVAPPRRPGPRRSIVAEPGGVPDADVMARVADGDDNALAEIYRRYGGAVWAVARRVCGDRTLAEDVTQTVFTDLWRRPHRFDPSRGALRPWLVAQAHARAVDTVRSETARRRRQDRDAQLAPASPPDVETEVHLADQSEQVRRALAQLDAEERQAIVLSYFGGHSYRETAALLGAPEGTVKSRIRRGLLGLRRALEAEGMAP